MTRLDQIKRCGLLWIGLLCATPVWASGAERVRAFFRLGGRRLAFLHVSGLETAGADSGWLSADYLAELAYIDMALAPLIEDLRRSARYAVIVTSDHAGHGRQHGTNIIHSAEQGAT